MIEEHKRKVMKEIDEVCGVKIVCDKCEKIILNFVDGDSHNKKDARYFRLVTGHHDWGNDSPDSVEVKDLCCETCVTNALADYFEDSKDSNTAYFELSRARAVVLKDWKTGVQKFYKE